MVEPKCEIAPAGSPLFVALSHASAKHSLVELNSPTLHPTVITNGRRLLFVNAFTCDELSDAPLPQLDMDPWPV
jgi:hypothetical protein